MKTIGLVICTNTIHKFAENLGRGIINPASRDAYWRIIGDLVGKVAQGIILGCTEIPLLLAQNHGDIPLFDTTMVHPHAAVDYALAGSC